MKNKKFWAVAGILLIAVGLSFCVGRYPLALSEIWTEITGGESGMAGQVFWQIRAPRTFLVLLCGMALSVSGMVYQNIFQNPLVSPDVLGVTSGASVGAAAAILTGAGAAGTAFSAFGAGVATVALTAAAAKAAGGRQQVTLLISGIVAGALAGSLLMILKYLADPANQLPSIDFWLMGSFHTAGWEEVRQISGPVCAALFLLWLFRWKLRLLVLGEEEAKSLGLPAGAVRMGGILLATLLAVFVVAAAGAVSWIGLIVPHLVRQFAGDDLRKNFGICMMGGGAFLLFADLAARSLTSAEIPVSILTSLAGAVLLLFLLISRRKKGGWL